MELNNGKILFSISEDAKLVEEVSKHPYLYSMSNPLYKNQRKKDNAWEEIGKHVGRSVEDCKKRWRNIKDTHMKRQRRGAESETSSSSSPKKWILADMLTFLDSPDCKRKNILSNECGGTPPWEDSIELEADPLRIMPCDNVSSSFNKTSSARVKSEKSLRVFRSPNKCQNNKTVLEPIEDGYDRRTEPSMSQGKNCDDDVDLFFKSIALSIKKLRPELINEAKMQSLQMLFELENRNKVE